MKLQTIFYALFIVVFGLGMIFVHAFRYIGLMVGGKVTPPVEKSL